MMMWPCELLFLRVVVAKKNAEKQKLLDSEKMDCVLTTELDELV